MKTLETWHRFVATQDPQLLSGILADDCSFHSPVFWNPKTGRQTVTIILTAASQIFSEFQYVRELADNQNAFLEFEASIGKLKCRGVDIIAFDEHGKIVDFEVMIRPANSLQAVGEAMAEKISSIIPGQ